MLWTMEHFRILPTDERFERLTVDQMEILYFNFLNTPSEDAARRHYWKTKTEKSKVESLPVDFLQAKMGYSSEDVSKLKKELENHG